MGLLDVSACVGFLKSLTKAVGAWVKIWTSMKASSMAQETLRANRLRSLVTRRRRYATCVWMLLDA